MEVKVDADELCELRKKAIPGFAEAKLYRENLDLKEQLASLQLRHSSVYRFGDLLYARESDALKVAESTIAAKDKEIAALELEVGSHTRAAAVLVLTNTTLRGYLKQISVLTTDALQSDS